MINLTQKAKNKLIELIIKDGKSAMLYLKGGGCNGFGKSYPCTWRSLVEQNTTKI